MREVLAVNGVRQPHELVVVPERDLFPEPRLRVHTVQVALGVAIADSDLERLPQQLDKIVEFVIVLATHSLEQREYALGPITRREIS